MKYAFCLILVCAALPLARAAADDPVQPHLWNDLNGNGVTDSEEAGSSSSAASSIEDVSLPDTPPDDTGQTSSDQTTTP